MSPLILLDRFSVGYGEAYFRGQRYATIRQIFTGGRSQKFYAEALGGTDFVSLNLYQTARGEQLRPCEMTAEKVLTFLREAVPVTASSQEEE